MDSLIRMIEELGLPFAYGHFAEGESPEPPFVCYLLPGVVISPPMGGCIIRTARCGWKSIPIERI